MALALGPGAYKQGQISLSATPSVEAKMKSNVDCMTCHVSSRELPKMSKTLTHFFYVKGIKNIIVTFQGRSATFELGIILHLKQVRQIDNIFLYKSKGNMLRHFKKYFHNIL